MMETLFSSLTGQMASFAKGMCWSEVHSAWHTPVTPMFASSQAEAAEAATASSQKRGLRANHHHSGIKRLFVSLPPEMNKRRRKFANGQISRLKTIGNHIRRLYGPAEAVLSIAVLEGMG
jgi:hypothetical protein